MIPAMNSEAVARSRRPVVDFVPFAAFALAVMLAVLGQAAWLDGKIERLDTKLSGEIKHMDDRLDGRIEVLQEGQAMIRERLAGVESRLDGVESRLGGVESRLDGLENRVAGLERSVGAISRHPSEPAS